MSFTNTQYKKQVNWNRTLTEDRYMYIGVYTYTHMYRNSPNTKIGHCGEVTSVCISRLMEGDECPCECVAGWQMGLLAERMTAITIGADQWSLTRLALSFHIASRSLTKETSGKYSLNSTWHPTCTGNTFPSSLPSI